MNGLLEHIHEVDGIGADLGRIVVVGRSEDFDAKRVETRPLPSLTPAASGIPARCEPWDPTPEAFSVIDAHLGERRRVLMLAQAREHGEARQRCKVAGAHGAALSSEPWISFS